MVADFDAVTLVNFAEIGRISVALLLVRSRAGDETLTDSDRLRLAVLFSADLFGHEITLHLADKKLIDSELWQNMFENNQTHLTEPTLIALLKGRPGPLSKKFLQALNAGSQAGSVTTETH